MPTPEVLQQEVDDLMRTINSPKNMPPTIPDPSLIAAPHLLVNPHLNYGQESRPPRPTRAQMVSMNMPLPGFLYPVEPTHPVWSFGRNDRRYKLNKRYKLINRGEILHGVVIYFTHVIYTF